MIDVNIQAMFNGYYLINADKSMRGNMDRVKPLTLIEANKHANFAGRLKDNIVMVDFDDKDHATRMLQLVTDEDIQCNVIQTTKGMHFYFDVGDADIKCTVNTQTLLGLNVDYKLGSKMGYAPLRIENNYRKILKSVKKLDILPVFLEMANTSLVAKFTKTNGKFYGYKTGDARNNFLLDYMIYLWNIEKLNKEDIIYMYRLINKYVFTDPLSQFEIDTICRDDAFDGITEKASQLLFFGGEKGKTFLHDEFARYIRDAHNIVKLDGVLQIYIDGTYYADVSKFDGVMLKYIPTLKIAQRREVLAYIAGSLTTIEASEADTRYIRVINGVYDLTTKELLEPTYDMIFKNKINAEYNEGATCAIVDKFIRDFTCGDHEIELLIWELVAYCMIRKQKKKSMFFLYGPRAHNAKSTLLAMLSEFLGTENVSNVEPQDIGGTNGRFNKVELYGKLANIVDDVDSGYIENTGVIKSMSDGRQVSADRKGQSHVYFNNYATFVFGGNSIPNSKDKTDGWYDRLKIIPCNAYFPPNASDTKTNMDELITTNEARSYILNKAIEAYDRIETGGFTIPQSVINENLAHKLESNTVLQFFEEYGLEFEKTYLQEIYLAYCVWCDENSVHTKATQSQLKQEISVKGYKVGDARRLFGTSPKRYFVKIDCGNLKVV